MERQRLSWKEIQDKYPDQWVGLTDVKYIEDDGISIESGIVKYINQPKGELSRRMLEGEIISRYTTPDRLLLRTLAGERGK